MKKFNFIAAFFVCVFLSASCVGIKSSIVLKKDGSGKIDLEYKIAKELLTLGAQDGNAAYPAVPAGEEDFKRTIDRIEGLKLSSFTSKDEGENLVYKVSIEYSTIAALSEFMDTQGTHFYYSAGENESLYIVFSPGVEEYPPEMRELFPVIFDGYSLDFKIDLPKKCGVTFFDKAANTLPALPVGEVKTTEKSVEFSAPMSDLFATGETVAMRITW